MCVSSCLYVCLCDLSLCFTFIFCFVFFCFFFFKQKTAYEMRISDWSSDVCSSDLASAGQAAHGQLGHHLRRRGPLHTGILSDAKEIGRASCRERVCQYV